MLRRSLGTCGLVLLLATAVSAQPGPGGPGGRGGMFGRMNLGALPGAELMLLGNPGVQKEISITDEQKPKVTDLQQETMQQMRSSMPDFSGVRDMSDEERTKFFEDLRKKAEERGKKVEEKLGKILDAKQMERLKQLQLQSQGVQALTNPDVVAKLKLSKDAQDKVQKIIDGSRTQFQGFDFRNATDEERKAFFDKMQKQREETMKSALKVLDDDQLVEWGAMIGKEFKFEGGPGFGRGGFFGGRGGPGGGGNNPPPQNNQ